MKLKSIRKINNLQGKKILLRAEFDLPLLKSGVIDVRSDERINNALPTIKYLLKKGAVIIILTHVGRPKGHTIEKLRLNSIADRLSQKIRKKVIKYNNIYDDNIKRSIKKAKNGDIFMLENLRFDIREERNNKEFAKNLANFGDIYVNEAFSNSHRKHASMVSITKYLPSYAGFHLEKEVKNLIKISHSKKKPFTIIMGGSKILSKIDLIKKFHKISDFILLGGALSNTALLLHGFNTGKSLIEKNISTSVKKFIRSSNKIYLPIDAVCIKNKKEKNYIAKVQNIKKDFNIVDIGPQTINEYSLIIKKSKTLIWNGPMGILENKKFSLGTTKILDAIMKSRCRGVIGGGETISAIKMYRGKINRNIFISSGGGAMLDFLQSETLPALKPLAIKN